MEEECDIFFIFPPQGAFVYSEKFSSFCAAVVEGIERLQNFFPAHRKGNGPVASLALTGPFFGPFGVRAAAASGRTFRISAGVAKRILGQYGESLTEISHFTDISGPGILRDPEVAPFFGKPCQDAAGALVLIGKSADSEERAHPAPGFAAAEVQLQNIHDR